MIETTAKMKTTTIATNIERSSNIKLLNIVEYINISSRTIITVILFMIAIVYAASAAAPEENLIQRTQENDVSCFHCHSVEVEQFQTSVHSDKILCVDCHGGDIAINGSLVSTKAMYNNFTGTPSKINIKKICSKCHSEVVKLYEESAHENALTRGRNNAASCLDCHNTHNILSYKDPKSTTYFENVPQMCANCHENQTTMQAWYYGIQTDRFDTYKNSYHYKAIILGGGKGRSLATCNDCHENHNTMNESDPRSTIYPANLIKTCEKVGCHSDQKALIYGGKVHEGQSVYIGATNIDLKSLVTYLYIAMIMFELCFSIGLIALGVYSQIDIKKRG